MSNLWRPLSIPDTHTNMHIMPATIENDTPATSRVKTVSTCMKANNCVRRPRCRFIQIQHTYPERNDYKPTPSTHRTEPPPSTHIFITL